MTVGMIQATAIMTLEVLVVMILSYSGVLADCYVAVQSDKGDVELRGVGHGTHDLIPEEASVHVRSQIGVEEVENLEMVR